MAINSGIFKAYDIRGVYHKDFELSDVKKIAQAFVKFTGAKKVVVGRDMRTSGDELTTVIIDGLLSQGAEVISIGLCTTPSFNFAVADNEEYDGGIMVTASHNPSAYNGFKLTLADGLPLAKNTGMDDIKRMVFEDEFEDNRKDGHVEQKDFTENYFKKVFSLVDISKIKPMRIVVDTGNGMGGMIVPKLFKRLKKLEYIHLYKELDGTFPNHEPNPLKEENLEDLKKSVLEHEADFGIAYDGDADRIGFVDEKAQTVPGDIMTGLLAQELLKNNPGEIVLYDLRSTNATREAIEEAGGKAKMCMVGHALIKKMMREEKALFAGELSSHFYYRDFYNVESNELTALLVMKLISESGKSFSELANPLKKYYHSGEINSEVRDKEAKMREIEEKYKDQAKNVYHLDGIRMDFKDWWFNVRPSNTEPKLRLNLEAKTKNLMEEKRDELLNIIRG